MRSINRKLFFTLKILYIIVFLVSVGAILATPTIPDPYLGFIQGGIIEMTLFMTSIILFHHLKIRLALICGFIGVLILGIDIMYMQFLISIAEHFVGFQETRFIIPICWVILLGVNIILLIGKLCDKGIDFNKVKKEILDLGVKFTRLEIKAIAEKLNQDPAIIVEIIQDMVEKQEIHGFYFDSTKTITFNQQANIDEIDKLMSQFQELEGNNQKIN